MAINDPDVKDITLKMVNELFDFCEPYREILSARDLNVILMMTAFTELVTIFGKVEAKDFVVDLISKYPGKKGMA
jgi:hypothetical protein